MHYTIQLNANGNTCYLVQDKDRFSITIKERNATSYDSFKAAREVHHQVMELPAVSLRALLKRESNFNKPVQVNVKSWRNDLTAPLTVRSKLYTFITQE